MRLSPGLIAPVGVSERLIRVELCSVARRVAIVFDDGSKLVVGWWRSPRRATQHADELARAYSLPVVLVA